MQRHKKHVSEGFKASENVVHSLMDRVGGALILLRQQLLYANEPACKLTGYSLKELKGLSSWAELVLEKDQSTLTDFVEQCLQGGVENSVESKISITTANGGKRAVIAEAQAVELEDGAAVLVTLNDMTAYESLESRLRDSEDRFKKTFHLSPAIVCIGTPEEGRFIDINDTFLRTFGFTREEVIGHTSEELGIWPDTSMRDRILSKLKKQGQLRDLELPFKSKTGDIIYLLGSVDLININNEPCMLMVAQDISARKWEEEIRQAREHYLRSQQDALLALAAHESITQGDLGKTLKEITETAAKTLNVARVGIWFYEGDYQKTLSCRDQFTRHTGKHSSGDVLREAEWPEYFRLIQSDLVVSVDDVATDPLVTDAPEKLLASSDATGILAASIRLAGKTVGVLVHEQVGAQRKWLLEEQNFAASLADMVALSIDQQKRRATEIDLHREKELAQTTLEAIGDGVITTDIAGVIDYLNPVAEDLTGWSKDAAEGKTFSKLITLIDESSRKEISDPVERCVRKQHAIRLYNHVLLAHRDRRKEYSIEVTVSPIRNREGQLTGTVMVMHDVTELRGMARKLSYQATHDDLTDLVNRREFERQMNDSLSEAGQAGVTHAMCYMDLDRFKVVNDTCGHFAGDALLKQLGAELLPLIRDKDTFARLGGDEFGILFRECSLSEAERMADSIRRRIEKFRFEWDDKVFEIGVSMGLVAIDGSNDSIVELLSAADSACYVAKDRGRNRVHVYQPGDTTIAKRYGEMEWLQRISQAFEEERFQLFYQPIAPLSDEAKKMGGKCELLLRMMDQDGKLLAPKDFIAAAERYHLMPTLDRWVVRNAFLLINDDQVVKEVGATSFSINLSGQSLGDDRFLDYVIEQLDETGVDTSRVCFEITETAAIANLARAQLFITKLKERGCSFSLDDFGRGLSSFGYLKNFTVDYLKIDGIFVRDIAHDPIDYAMVEAINQVGHIVGIATIAESVENESTLNLLKAMGMDYVQGSQVAEPRPMPKLRYSRKSTPSRLEVSH